MKKTKYRLRFESEFLENSIGTFIIPIEKFREKLEIPDSYLFADIKRRIIIPSILYLEKSGWVIHFEEIKINRRVCDLKFTYAFDVLNRRSHAKNHHQTLL